MQMSVRCFTRIPLAAPLALFMAACATPGRSLDESRDVTIVIEPCSDLTLSAHAYVLDGEFHVHGTVRTASNQASVPGYLDLIVRTAEGEEWASARADYRNRMRRRPRGGWSSGVFDATFEDRPPQGAVVTLRHHEQPHEEE